MDATLTTLRERKFYIFFRERERESAKPNTLLGKSIFRNKITLKKIGHHSEADVSRYIPHEELSFY